MKILEKSHKMRRKSGYVHAGATGRFTSPIVLLKRTPMPSNTPSKMPQATAEPNVAFGPPIRNCQQLYPIGGGIGHTSQCKTATSHES
jgi:hypothetical protein